MRGDGDVEDVDGDCPPQDGIVVGDDDDDDFSLREGEIEAIIITNDPLIERGSISINIFTKTISSQTLVHLLYPTFVSKPQIGTYGLLVVLITPCS